MAYAVSAWFDTETDREIRALWQRMAEEGISRFLHDGPFRPHLTLAIYEDVPIPAISEALRELAGEQTVFAVPLASIGVFPGTDGVVFLGATRTPLLSALHQHVHARLAALGTGPNTYYLPSRWNPHCTVACFVPSMKIRRAVGAVLENFVEREACIERIGLIETPAEREIGFWRFPAETVQP